MQSGSSPLERLLVNPDDVEAMLLLLQAKLPRSVYVAVRRMIISDECESRGVHTLCAWRDLWKSGRDEIASMQNELKRARHKAFLKSEQVGMAMEDAAMSRSDLIKARRRAHAAESSIRRASAGKHAVSFVCQRIGVNFEVHTIIRCQKRMKRLWLNSELSWMQPAKILTFHGPNCWLLMHALRGLKRKCDNGTRTSL